MKNYFRRIGIVQRGLWTSANNSGHHSTADRAHDGQNSFWNLPGSPNAGSPDHRFPANGARYGSEDLCVRALPGSPNAGSPNHRFLAYRGRCCSQELCVRALPGSPNAGSPDHRFPANGARYGSEDLCPNTGSQDHRLLANRGRCGSKELGVRTLPGSPFDDASDHRCDN